MDGSTSILPFLASAKRSKSFSVHRSHWHKSVLLQNTLELRHYLRRLIHNLPHHPLEFCSAKWSYNHSTFLALCHEVTVSLNASRRTVARSAGISGGPTKGLTALFANPITSMIATRAFGTPTFSATS